MMSPMYQSWSGVMKVRWMHQQDFTGDCPTIKLCKLAKTKKLPSKILKSRKMSKVAGSGKRKGYKFTKEELDKSYPN